MKVTRYKYLIIMLLGALMCTSTTYAKSGSETVHVLSGGISIVVDKVKIEPKDATGKKVEPFILNGSTYLPVRAIANALHMDVEWDDVAKTVYLTESLEEDTEIPATSETVDEVTDGSDTVSTGDTQPNGDKGKEDIGNVYGQAVDKTITIYYQNIDISIHDSLLSAKDANGNRVEPFISDGTTYLPVRAIGEALNKPVFWDGDTKTVYIGEMITENETDILE